MGHVIINSKDNVSVNLETGHKTAIRDIDEGEDIIKYGFPIGFATCRINAGDAVHTHNMKTRLSGTEEIVYAPKAGTAETRKPFMINAYVRQNGDIGIRNDIWIVNTVGCVNGISQKLATLTGAFSFTHPYGCSQLGGDHRTTQLILRGLIRQPNAGGVLVLGLGCENNNIGEMKKVLGTESLDRVRFLNVQDCADELTEGVKLIKELETIAAKDVRVSVPVSRLKIGLKCGGSDGLSGITANPAVGAVTDILTSMGSCVVMTEVPEMFGAEQILFERCVSNEIFCKATALINNYKSYFIAHGQPVSENPSPGNKAGGITTLEEKSLGCVQKGGAAPITDVLAYGDKAVKPGLNLLNGPGNDIVSTTNLTAAGCNLILFTTGRGTPLGAPIPTVKISTNSTIAQRKPQWIDFDSGKYGCPDDAAAALIEYIKTVSNGTKTSNEKNGYREIAIFKDGVTL